MKKLIIIVAAAIAVLFTTQADAAGTTLTPAFPSAAEYSSYEKSELTNLAIQLRDYSDAIGQAQAEQVMQQLKLTGKQRTSFEKVYNMYRKDIETLTEKTDDNKDVSQMNNEELLKYISVKLDNIARVAKIKSHYLSPFSQILSAEQIRALYNAEGQVSMQLKTAAGNNNSGKKGRRTVMALNLKGSGVLVTENRGAISNYTSIHASQGINAVVSSSAKELTVTADDNVIKHVKSDVVNGELRLRIDANSTSNTTVRITVPRAQSLSAITATSAASVSCPELLRAEKVSLSASSSGTISTSADTSSAFIQTSSCGKFKGSVKCNNAEIKSSSSAEIDAEVEAGSSCSLALSSCAKFTGKITAGNLDITASSSSIANAAMNANKTTMRASSTGSIKGSISAVDCKMYTSSCGAIKVAFSASSFYADASSAGRINLTGESKAEKGVLNLRSAGQFHAPAIQVRDYDISASSGSEATVYGAYSVKANTTSGAKVNFANKPTKGSISNK